MTTSEPYLINKLQTPYGLQVVYDAIDQGAETDDELAAETQLKDTLIEESVAGLRLMGLLRRTEHTYKTVELERRTGNRETDFRVSAIHHLAQEADSSDWGKQAAVLLNYQYLLREDRQAFENNEEALYEDIDFWLETTTDYRPKGDGELYAHNDNKFQNWTRLVHALGLVHKVGGRQYTVYPDPELVLESIRWAAEESSYGEDAEADVSLVEYLQWLDSNFIRVGYEAGDSVPAVLARVLYGLVKDEVIRLIEYGDASVVSLNRVPTSSSQGIDQHANSIKLR